MLRLVIPSAEFWSEENQEFVYTKSQNIQLEHSLVSLSKWEARWEKAFLDRKEKTLEEMVDYVRCMTITQNVDPDAYKYLTNENMDEINQYINAPMTATSFSSKSKKSSGGELVTAEIIYYWMIMLNIPLECQKWHLNRLFTLIRVCGIKNTPQKNKNMQSVMRENAALNAARRKRLHSRG